MRELYPLTKLTEAPYSSFFAIPLPDDLKKLYAELVGKLARLRLPVTFQQTATPHITVAFLGDLNLADLDQVLGAGGALSRELQAFEVQLIGCQHFGRPGERRVLWQSVNPSATFQQIHDKLSTALPPKYREKRPYAPHFTIARIQDSSHYARYEKEVSEILQTYKFTFEAHCLRLYGAIGTKRQTPLAEFNF